MSSRKILHKGNFMRTDFKKIEGTLTLAVHWRWEEERVREWTGHTYARAKKMKSLTLHTQGCLRDSAMNYW